MKLKFLIIFACLNAFSNQCNTPDKGRGVLTTLSSCPVLTERLRKKEITVQRLKQFQDKDGTNMFCCPLEISLPNWQEILKQKLPQPPHCGQSHESLHRVVGGEETAINEFPWTVLLQYENPNNNSLEFHCGGSLINKRYVLTAAHCIEKMKNLKLKKVRIGEWNLDTVDDCDGNDKSFCAPAVIDNLVVEKEVHPEYRASSSDQTHDIALLRLAKPIKFNNFVQPICLPLDTALTNKSYTGTSLSVAGWGQTPTQSQSSKKLKISIEGREPEVCIKAFEKTGRSISGDYQLCVGGTNGKDSCNGDSGGPLMAYNVASTVPYWYLAGIVSFGHDNCTEHTLPGVYSKVSKYLNWIASKIRD